MSAHLHTVRLAALALVVSFVTACGATLTSAKPDPTAATITAPRDPQSGMPTGKRQ